MKYRAPLPHLPLALKQTVAAVLIPLLVLTGSPVSLQAADYYWDQDGDSSGNALSGTNLGGAGTWDLSASAWWDGLSTNLAWPNLSDTAIFTGTAGTVTLGENITAGGLRFNVNGYTIAPSTTQTLTLAPAAGFVSPVIAVNNTGFGTNGATISAILAGTSGFTKTGNGTLRLTGANTFSGDVAIKGGSIVITNPNQLGTGTTAISVTGVGQTGNPGFSGGSLVLQGTGTSAFAAGLTIDREISGSGRGAGAINQTGSLISIGYNTLAGGLTNGSASDSRVWASHGATTVTGNVSLGSGSIAGFQGNGNWIISGRVTGTDTANDRFFKAGNTVGNVLWLQNANNSYMGSLRIESGNVRVQSNGALGIGTMARSLDLENSTVEFRTDLPGSFSTRNVMVRADRTGVLFLDHDITGPLGVGSSLINQTITFGNFSRASGGTNSTFSFSGRNGYGFSATGASGLIGGENATQDLSNFIFTNNSNGLGTLIGNAWNTNQTTPRTFTVGGNAETVLTGNVLATGATHHLTKSGTGTFTYNGTAGTFTGSTTVTGTLAISSMSALNSSTGIGAIQLSNGALDYRGIGDTSNRLLNLSGTTTAGIILANQSSGSELVFSGKPVAAGGAGNKLFYLGGDSAPSIVNEIGGVISINGGTTGLSKVGSNTWLYSPAASTYLGGTTQTTGGSASGTSTNIITLSATNPSIVVGQSVSGTNVPAGSVVIGVNGTTLTISNNIGTTAIAAGTTLTFGGTSNFTGNVTVSGGTLQVRPTAAAGNGSDVINNSSQVIFNSDALRGNQWAGGTFEYLGSSTAGALTETVGLLAPSAGAGVVKTTANGGSPILSFSGYTTRGAGAVVNFQQGTGTGIRFSAVPTAVSNGLVSGAFITDPSTGAIDFVATPATNTNLAALGAATAFPTSIGAATGNYLLSADTTTSAAVAANSVRITGGAYLTLGTGNLTLTSASASALGGILHDNAGGASVISGQTITTSASNQEVLILTGGTGGASNTLSINSILGNGSGGVTKGGSGTLILGGANTYTGTLTINEGTVQLAGSGTLGAANAGLMMRQGTTLDLNGISVGSVSANGLNAFNGAGTITNSAASGTATLRVGNNNSAGLFSGVIQDGANAKIQFAKAGSGTVSLTGANTFSGPVTVTAGTLAVTSLTNIGEASGIGKGDSTSAATNAASLVFNGGTLQYTGSNASIYQTTQTPSVSIDRLFTLAGNGTIQSSGQYGNSILAAGSANNATLIWNNTADVSFSGTGTRTLTLGGNSTGDNEMRIRLRDNPNAGEALSLTKADAGLWILNPATSNTYTGTTTVSAGSLRVASSVAAVQGLSTSSPLVLNGGVLETSGTFSRTLGAPVAGTGTTVQLPAGTSGFAAATPDRLVVTIGGGGLTWGSTNFSPSALVLGSATALGETEITNDINLGSSARTVTVNANANTATMVTAGILSGVISGSTGGALTKNGTGVLMFGNANTYIGNTTVNDGTLVITSFGNSSGTISSSLGASGGSLIVNQNATSSPILYVGPGETSSRPLVFQTALSASRTHRIDASGSGPLVLTNVTNSNTGAFTMTLELRGSNVDNNMITSTLADNGTSLLGVSKADGGVWILNPSSSNTFTGPINANGGLLGLTTAGIGSASAIGFSNGGIFAYGSALSTSKPISHANNSTAVIAGQNNITLGGTWTIASGDNDQTISNNLENGAVLTVNGNFVNSKTNNRVVNVRGFGSTVWNGVIPNASNGTNTTAWNIAIANDATFTFGGSSANTYTGATTLAQGTLILNKTLGVAQIGTGTSQFNFAGGVLRSDAGALTGANALNNTVFLTGDPAVISGTNSIQMAGVLTNSAGNRLLVNNLSGGGNLTLSGNVSLSNDNTGRTLTVLGSGSTTISGIVQNGGTAAGGLTYSGNGTLNLGAANTATGTLTANRGTVSLGGSGSWAGGIAFNPTGTVTLDYSGGNVNRLADAGAVTGNGGTLNFIGNSSGTSETTGTLTLNTAMSSIAMTGSGPNVLTFGSLATPNSGSSLDLSSIPSLGSTNKVIFTAAPTLTNSINTRIFVNGGADFATHTANGVEAFTGYNNSNDLNTALSTDTMNLTGSAATTANRTVNAIKLNGTGIAVTGAALNRLTLGAAGILNTGGDNSIGVNEVAFGATTGFVQVASGTTLTLNGNITGSNGWAKVLPGSLAFGAGGRSFVTGLSHNVLDGTVTLNGGADTFFPNQLVVVNTPGVIDLNGGGQYAGTLSSSGTLPSAGGTITSTGGVLVTNKSASTSFAGTLAGSLNFGSAGGSTLTLASPQTYTGTTLLMGGTTTLENDATLLNTSEININGGSTLFLSNNTGLQTQNNNRIGDAIALNLRGGTVSVTGRISTAATETFGAVSSLQGANTLTATTGGGTITSVDLNFASLTRSAGTTVNFTGTNIGQQGNNARIVFDTAPSVLGSGVLGAWAIANSTDYAAYNAGLGVGIVGQGGFTGYDGSFGSGNITLLTATSATTTNLTAPVTTSALLRFAGGFSNDLTFADAGNILNLELGGILRSDNNNSTTIGTTSVPGIITSGTSELVVYNAQGTTTINSQVTGATGLVKSGAGTLALSNLSNNYSLGTIVSQGTLSLTGGATANGTTNVVIPAGGLTLTNSTVTMATNAGQIHNTNAVTLNGASTLTLVGANTLDSLTFNNNGGTAAPTVTSGGLLTLSNATPITVSSSNPAFVATIAGSIDIGSGAKTINTPSIQVGGVTVTNLVPTLSISAAILSPGASMNKTGDGLLQLGGASTFSGFTLSNGGVVLAGNSSPTSSPGAGSLASGPLGIGSVSVASGTTILASASNTIANPITFAGTPTFDSTANTAWTLTFNGPISGLSSTPTVQVTNPGLTVNLAGNIPGPFSSITKTGLGALIFNATNYTGNFNAAALGNAAAVTLLHDGDTTSSVQTLSVGDVVFDAGIVPSITVNRGGTTLAANKIIAPASISNLGLGITVTNSSGYGLQVSEAVTLTGTSIGVGTATGSNVTQGLYLSGVLSGTGFAKTGAGAVVLGNASNSFTGNININQGVVSAVGNAQLGNAANIIQLNPTTGTSTFRATGTYTLANPLQLSNTANTRAIEVTGGNALTLNTAFDLNAGAGNTAGLTKADNGTLLLSADNSAAWAGALTISQGAVEVGHNGALGTTAGNTVVSASGAALRLPAGFSVADPLSLSGTGILTGGALQGTGSGTSTASGAITLAGAAAIGADAGNTLNLTGGISGAQALTFAGAGNINLTGSALGAVSSVTKIGSGTTTLGVASSGFVGALNVNRGTFVLGSAGVGSVGATGLITVNQSGTLTVNNTTGPVTRWTNRGVTLAGGTLNYNTSSASPFVDANTSALTLNSGANVINMTNGGGSTTEMRFASLAFGAGASGNLIGLSPSSNLIRFTTTPALTPATTGIFPRLTVNGSEFATYNGTGITGSGIVPFTAYAAATNVLSAGPTQTYLATAAKSNSLTGNQTLNALTLESGPLVGNVPNVGGLGGLNPTTLTLTSGAILVRGSGVGTTSALSVPIVALGATEGVIHVASGQALNVTSAFSGTGGMTKALPGTLNLNQQQYVTGTTTVNNGTLKLQSGATNTLFFNNNLTVNTGGVVDLMNGSQFIANLASQGAGAGADVGGGIITNSGAQATLVTNANSSFGGSIQGTIFLNKTGTSTLTLTNPQTYSGATLISGGTVTLNDSGALSNTSGIDINFGGLALTNTGLVDSGDRVPSVPISLRGGIITLNGRTQTNSSETLGALTLVDGHSQIVNANGGTGINSSTLTFGSLTRSGSSATVRFASNNTTVGTIGSNARTFFTTAPTLTNNIIGPWAIIDREFASYDSNYGVGALNQTGFPGYSALGLNTGATASDNVRFTATGTTTLAGNTSVNTLTFGQQASATTLNLGGNTLTIAGGGLLFGQATDNVNFGITNGNLTGPSGGGDLFIHHGNYSGTNRTASIDAAIVDNGGAIRVIKSSGDTGASVMTLNGTNTYTGGTVINMGTLVLGATSTLGSGGITVNQGTLTQTAGAIIPSQLLTLGGGSTVTLAGNNSLSGITVNNLGGAAPTLTPTGTLTLTGGITATTSNAGAVATIGTGTLDLNGASAYSISVGQTLVNGIDVAPWQAGLIINSVITNGGISKSGDGILQLGGASTFSGGVEISSGGLIIAADTNSTVLGDPVVTGPVGTGTLTVGANTTVLAGGAARTITNNVVFSGDTVFNGINNLTFNGVTTLPSVWNATVTAPQMTVTIGDASGSLSTDEINKSGLGILSVGSYNGTINATGGLLFSADGNTLGTQESLVLGSNINITGDTAVTVNRSGGAPNARNKVLQQNTLTNGGSIMSVSNQSGYGLEFTGTTTLNGASHFAVGTATASNVVPGLILSGVVSDAGGYDLTKSGPGTLVLGNSGNTFGGSGKVIDILGGIVAAGSDGALGDSGNQIRLNADATTGAGFRATGSFATDRTFVLNQPNNAIEVSAGYMLELDQPFSVTTATNALNKNDNGVVAIDADNTGWTGAVNINAGAVRAKQANALGSGTVTIAAPASGAALQLENASLSNPIAITVSADSVTAGGMNNGGAIQSVAGSNSVNGAITVTGAPGADNVSRNVTLGADSGASLNIAGGVTVNHASGGTGRSMTLFLAGAGNGTLSSSVTNLAGSPGTFTVNKIGSGTWSINTSNAVPAAAVAVSGGALNISGTGNTLSTASTTAVTVNANGTLNITDSGTAAARLGGRPVTLQGGTVNYTGNSAGSSETLGALTFNRMGGVFSSTQTSGGNVALTFASLTFGTDGSANFQGTNLGTASNRILFTTAPTLVPASTGILARATVNGADFATYGATNGIAAFTAYQNSNNPNTAAATDTMNLTANAALTANRTLNAVKINGSSAVTLGGAAFNQLTLTSGGVLATGAATHVINVPVIANAAVQSVYHVDSGSSLSLQSTLTGTAGLVKDGAGTLIVSSPASITGLSGVNGNTLTGNTVIARGTVQLNGGRNTLTPGNFIVMGGPGATLDLNGNSQQISGFMTDTTAPGSGGIVTNTSGTTAQLIINQDNAGRTFAGSLTGLLNFVRSGQNTLTLPSASSFTGTTSIIGGTTTLASDGAFTGTSSIDINYATLTLDNNAGFNGLADRINDSAAVTMRGGTLIFQGRAQTASTETIGAVILQEGQSAISSVVGGTGVNSADLTLTSLTRVTGGGTVNFTAATGGQIGSSSRILIPTINGNSTATLGGGLSNGIIGGWATIGTTDFATYVPGLGIAAMGSSGALPYSNANSNATTLNTATSTDNISINAAVGTIPVTNDTTINSLRMGNVASNTVAIAAGKTLTLTSGGLLFFSSATQTIGSAVNQGNLTTTGPELFVYAQGTGPQVINSVISGSGVALVKTGGNALTLNGTNTYDGGTTVQQGTLTIGTTGNIPLASNPANGLTINGGTVTLSAAGSIDSGNIVTINDGGTLNLYGNNTLAGLVFNNTGGTTTPSANSFVAPTATVTGGSNGVLTIGSSGITATSMNVATTSQVGGRVDFGSSSNTINVAPITVNGINAAPLQATLALQGVVGSAGGITKSGNGVLQFNAPTVYTGPTTVSAGGIRAGVANAGSRFSALTLNSGTYLNLAGVNSLWGSLAGSGSVLNSSATNATLIVGFDNTDSSFGGQLVRFNDAALNGTALQKIGTGTQSMTSAQNFATGTTGTVTVSGGVLRYVDDGKAFPGVTGAGGTFTVQPNATLALDNSGTANVNNRLGANANGTLNLGGKLTVNGSSTASTPTTEAITTVAVTNGSGRIELTPNAANPLTLAITTLSGQNSNGSAVFAGITGAASADGVANLTITTPSLLGSQGTGANGTATMAVRSDILADPSATGLGAGFLVRDSVTGNYRALGFDTTGTAVSSEFEANANTATLTSWGSTENIRLTSAQTIFANTPANTITASGTAGISSGLASALGIYGPGGAVLTQTLNGASGLLVLSGTTTVNTALASASGGTTPSIHVLTGATLNLNGPVGIGGTVGFLKADGGDLNINNRAFYTGGATTINGGTVTLNSGVDNTLAVVPGATTPTVNAVNVNHGGTLNLNGRSQVIGALASANFLPGQGGTVTSTGAAMLTSTGGGSFGGAINGAISFTRAGNNTTLLTSANGYTGATIVRGGTLQLRDSGSILSTSSISLQYGTLQIDQSFLNPSGNLNPTRVASGTAITMQGGGLTLTPGGSVDSSASLGAVTLTGGANTITPSVLASSNTSAGTGSVTTLTLANLVTSGLASSGGTLNIAAPAGQVGINQTRLLLTQLNGATPTNNFVFGPNVIVDSGNYGAYVTTQGIGALGTTGFPAYAAALASGNNLPANVSSTTADVTISANTTIGALRLGTNATRNITFTAGTEVLNLALGGLLRSNDNNATNIGTSALRGVLTTAGTATSGTVDLVAYNAQNTMTIESVIANNGLGATTRLLKSGAGTMTLTAQNTYTGGTVVNQGTLNLTGTTAGFVVIPAGGLTINNATVTQNTNAQQIATSTDVTINGGGALNLTTGANTLNSLTWNNTGGTGNPTVNGGSGLFTLTSATPITATNDSFATTPVLSGAGGLALSNASPVINVAGLSPNSLNISAVISSAGGAISKTGAGALTLSGANTFTTGFNLNAGSLIFGVSTTGTLPAVTNGPVGTGTLSIAGGTSILSDGTARTVGNPVTVNGDFAIGGRTAGNNVTLSGAMNLGDTGRTINVDSPAVTGTISGAITSTATGTALTKTGNGTLTLSSASNNFNGASVSVTGGVLKNGVNNAIPNASNVAISSGAGYDLNNFDQTLQTISGTGFITNSANASKTLTLGGTSSTDVTTNVNSTFGGVLTDNMLAQSSSRLVLTKVGLGSLTLSGNSTYNGATNIIAGSIIAGTDNALPTNTALTIGTSATTAGNTATLDLTNFSQTVASLTTATTVATASGNVIIGAGKTLTVTGPVSLGVNGSTVTTRLNVSGAGTFSIGTQATPTNSNVTIGNNSTSNVSNGSTLDLSGLSNFYANLGTGTFRVGDPSNGGGTATLASTLLLAPNSTITATSLRVESDNSNQTQVMKLGTGTNRLNVNTLNVGAQNGRSSGTLDFLTGAGSVTLRGLAGGAATPDETSRADVNISNNSFGTGASHSGSFDVTGHNADLMVGTMTVGGRTGSTGTATGTFSFDTGTLDANNLILGTKGSGSTATSAISGTVNLNGGTSTLRSTTSAVQLGVNASTAAGTATGTLNVGGNASVTVAANGGNSFVLGNATAAGGTAAGSINVTGGSLAVQGDIVRGATTGTSTAALNLNGGSLDMGGNRIGGAVASANLTSLTFAAGTLQNVAEINNGAALDKTTAGVLILSGTNGYTGVTNVNAGTVRVQSNTGLGSSSAGTVVSNGATLQLDSVSVASEQITLNGTGAGAAGALQGTGTASSLGDIVLASNSSVGVTAEADTLTLGGPISGSASLEKVGSGTVVLAGDSTYGGNTLVSGGSLFANNTSGSATGSGSVTVGDGDGSGFEATLGGTGTISGTATISSTGRLTAGGYGTTGTLSFGADLISETGSTWLVDLAGGGSPLSDRIHLAGALTLNDALLTINDTNWTYGNQFTVASYGNLNGLFFWNGGALGQGATFSTALGEYKIDYGLGATTITAVPEPSQVIAIVLLLALGLWFGRRRLRAAADGGEG